MAVLRAAIAGTGFMGFAHTEALRRIGIPISGILGSRFEKGEASARQLNLPRAYRDFDELASDPEVGVVHICTPNHLHFPMAKQALLMGKHVICEKPLAVSSQESAELLQLARQKGLTGVVCHNLRFYPACHEARELIRTGEIGEVRLVQGAYWQDWLVFPTDWSWRLDPRLGGPTRVIADVGTHWLDMVTWLTGLRVKSLVADLATFIKERRKPRREVATFSGKLETAGESDPVVITSEDAANLIIEFNNGARGVLSLSQVSPGRKNYLWWEMSGSRASLRWDQENPNQLWVGYRDGLNRLFIKDPALMHPIARPFAAYPGGHAEGYPDTFVQLFRMAYQAMEAGKPVDEAIVPTFEAGHRGMLYCNAILKSSHERRWIEIEAV